MRRVKETIFSIPLMRPLWTSLKKAARLPRFLGQFFMFRRMAGVERRFDMRFLDLAPHLFDATADTPFDPHYVYHPAWAARVLAETRPESHVDISSTLHFAVIASAFVPFEFYDYRPPHLGLERLAVGHADLTHLMFADESIASLSCMHTVEHIGLGRYGDPIDPEGDMKAMSELARVLARGGALLFVVPVGGRPRIEFNAHRVYSYEQVVAAFPELMLKEFSLVADDGRFMRNASPSAANRQEYGCGMFWFVKPLANCPKGPFRQGIAQFPSEARRTRQAVFGNTARKAGQSRSRKVRNCVERGPFGQLS